jgi:hypothetical protein
VRCNGLAVAAQLQVDCGRPWGLAIHLPANLCSWLAIRHCCRLAGGGISLEPNNLVDAPENCAGGNFSQAYDSAAGWGDASCVKQFPFICEVVGEWLGYHQHASCRRS